MNSKVISHIQALFATIILYNFVQVRGYVVTIDAHVEECFLEDVKAGAKLLSEFEVAEGGFLDIDFKILDPNNKEIHSGEKESSGKFVFNAQIDGLYKFCLGNKMSTLTPKTVLFSFESSEAMPTSDKAGDNKNKLEDMIKELAGKMISVKHEQDYMEIRDRVHRNINESTNSRIILWSIFEAVILIGMTVGQVFYLKRFFEVRRIV